MTLKRRQIFSIALFASLLAASCGGGSGTPPMPGGGTGGGSNIAVVVSPPGASVALNGSVQFTATVTGTTNTAVTWSAHNVQGGDSTFGTISSTGLYTAPAALPNPSAVSIVATSVADTTKTGNSTANVVAHHDNQDAQNAPIKLGTSGGNSTDSTTSTQNGQRVISCCSGTLGSLISRGGNQYILSNNHVLAKSDQGTIGDPISQPGLADTHCGQSPAITVAHLSQFVNLPTDGTTPGTVDAAMAQIEAPEVDTNGTILDLAALGQPAPPSATLATAVTPNVTSVAKSGTATGLSCSTILSINTNVGVDYAKSCGSSTTFHVVFDNQIIVSGGTFSNMGDSGSLIVTSDTSRPVALLYAGSSSNTAANPIQDVLTALKDPSSGEVPKIVGGADHPVTCPAGSQSQVAVQEKEGVSRVSDTEISRATAVKNRHSIELMQDPAVTGVGVGQSADNPAESAVVVFMKGQPRFPIPAQIDGVRTRIVPGSEFRAEQATAQQQSLALPAISDSEIARVRATKEKHAEELMSNPAILGVGVGASTDSPGQAALVVFVDQDKSVAVPAEIDGARTRVVVSDHFRTFDWGKKTKHSCGASGGGCGSCSTKSRR